MCVEIMDTTSTDLSTHCLRKHKFVSKITWKMLRVRTTEDTLKMLRNTAALRKRVRHKARKPLNLTKLNKGLGSPSDEEGQNVSATIMAAHAGVVRAHRRCSGAMAPENTTQYLMANAYEDMAPRLRCDAFAAREAPIDVYGESLSPTSISTALDSIYDDYLAFQQRDFEEVFGLLG